MKQLNMFEKLPDNILQAEWMKEHIKNPPPKHVTEQQRLQAIAKIENIRQLKITKHNFS